MATIDSTKIAKPSAIVEDEQGQLRARQGISREVVSELSKVKDEPEWMAEKRLRSLEIFERKPIPRWGVDLSGLNLDDLVLYSPPTAGRYNSWDEVPEEISGPTRISASPRPSASTSRAWSACGARSPCTRG